MSNHKQSSSQRRGSGGRWRDLIVVLAIAVVSAALGFGLYQQAGFGIGPSVIGGAALFVILTFLHVLMRRVQRVSGLEPRVHTLETRVDTLEHRSAPPRGGAPQRDWAGAQPGPEQRMQQPAAGRPAPQGPAPAGEQAAPQPLDLFEDASSAGEGAEIPAHGHGKVEPEVVDDLVRALAGELGRGRNEARLQDAAMPAPVERPMPTLSDRPLPQPPQERPIPLGPAFARPAQPELGAMPPPPHAAMQAPGVSAPAGEQGTLAAAIRAAESKGTVDILLQPVVSLADQKPRYYEVCPRIRVAGDTLAGPQDYARTAAEIGLLQGIERVTIRKAVTILKRLSERGRARGLFCNISRRLLATPPAMWDLFEIMKVSRPVGELLILELSQADYSALDAIEMESLTTLARLGYRFSLDGVEAPALSVKTLVDGGFGYVKLVPKVFAAGPRTEADVAQLVRDLSQAGIETIMDGIFDAALIPRFQQLGVLFGQGDGVSEPKPVRSDLMDGGQGAVVA